MINQRVNIAAAACIKKNLFDFMSINTEKINYKLIYLYKNKILQNGT